MTWKVYDLKPAWPFYIPVWPFHYLLTVQRTQWKCMQISFLCINSCLKLRLQNQFEQVLRDSPQFSYIRSLCLTVLHLHSEFLVTPCVDPFCRKPLLNTRRYLWCFQPLECPDFHHSDILGLQEGNVLACDTIHLFCLVNVISQEHLNLIL